MKNFFENKLNIILTVILVLVLGLAVFLMINITGLSFSKSIEAIDFTGYSQTQVEEWVKENKIKDGVYSYSSEYSDTVEKDYVVYQSVKAGDKITDSLVIVYSNGKDPNGELDMPTLTDSTSEEEIESWLNLNEFNNVTYVYQTDENKAFGTVISITPNKAKKSDAVTVLVSLGKNIEDIETEVPNLSTYTKVEIERWGARYGIDLKITYETHDQANEDEFISQSVAAGNKINGGDSMIVTLSSGKSDGSEATIPDTYLGISEADFLANLKELGFNNTSKSNTTYFAESLEKDTIYYYDDGTFPTSKTINYALCAGKYSFDASEYNGQTQSKAQSIADAYKARNARIGGKTLSITFTDGDNSGTSGNVYDCSISGATISCKVYGGSNSSNNNSGTSSTTATIPSTGLLGKTESEFVNYIKKLGFTNLAKSSTGYYSTTIASGSVFSYDDGTYPIDRTINYALSIGAYSFDASRYNNKTEDEVRSIVKDESNRNACRSELVVVFTNGNQNNDNAGKTYDCSFSGSTISCKLYTKGSDSNNNNNNNNSSETTASILSSNMIISNYSKSTFDEASSAIKGYFSSFPNLTINAVSSDKSAGTIVSISVGGNTSYNAGSYPTSTAIVVEISNGD